MFGQNPTIFRGPKPLKSPKIEGGQNFNFAKMGLSYTQMKGLDEHFQNPTLVLAYNVIMKSQSCPKLKICKCYRGRLNYPIHCMHTSEVLPISRPTLRPFKM